MSASRRLAAIMFTEITRYLAFVGDEEQKPFTYFIPIIDGITLAKAFLLSAIVAFIPVIMAMAAQKSACTDVPQIR